MYACVFEDDVRAAADLHMYSAHALTPCWNHTVGVCLGPYGGPRERGCFL